MREVELIDVGTVEGETLEGETLSILERVVVAPEIGRFRPLQAELSPAYDEVVHEGQVLGSVENLRVSTPVVSAFHGRMRGMLVAPGEEVHRGQPIAWLRAEPGSRTGACQRGEAAAVA